MPDRTWLEDARPRIINCAVPVRIADVGGWTDTWFAGRGVVCNIAVEPWVEVQIAARRTDEGPRITLVAENYGERYDIDPHGAPEGRHPLLEASIRYMQIPPDQAIEVTVYSEMPAGASTGTSAAVVVALLGALDRLRDGRRTPHQIAETAHHIEMNILGLQCGIQDQLASAYGGICLIEMDRFPRARVTRIAMSDSLRWELERRLVLVFLGRAHSSSDVHRRVIAELEGEGTESPRLEVLRMAALRARDALAAGDLAAYGRVLQENTEAQRLLHPDLVGNDATTIIEIARRGGAIGWKVNGAGGEGGSVTVLCDERADARRRLVQEIHAANPLFRVIPIHLAEGGLRVWESGDRPASR